MSTYIDTVSQTGSSIWLLDVSPAGLGADDWMESIGADDWMGSIGADDGMGSIGADDWMGSTGSAPHVDPLADSLVSH